MSNICVLGPIRKGHGSVVNVAFFVLRLEVDHQIAMVVVLRLVEDPTLMRYHLSAGPV